MDFKARDVRFEQSISFVLLSMIGHVMNDDKSRLLHFGSKREDTLFVELFYLLT
jgi:hypothetical protein